MFKYVIILLCLFSQSANAKMNEPPPHKPQAKKEVVVKKEMKPVEKIEKMDKSAEDVAHIASSYEKALFEEFPEMAMFWGRADSDQTRFSDHSLDALAKWQKRQDQFLDKLNKINVSSLKGKPELITYQLLKQTLENDKAIRICKDELWNVNPLWGWHNILSMVAEKQSVGTPTARQQALKRWKTFPKVVNDEINNLKVGMKQGYTAPKPAVQRVIHQLKIMVNTPVEQSPYFELARRDGDAAFKSEMGKVVEQDVNVSLKKYLQFLEAEYLPHARDKIGLSALPQGEQCYHAKVKRETTLTLPPRDIHEYGLQHMLKLTREVAEIGQRQFAIQTMTDVFKQAKQSPQNLFHSEQEILDYNLAALARAKEKVGAWFDTIPHSEGTLKPYPLHRAKTGAAGEYHPPSDDGIRPGIFYINTYEPEAKSRVDQEATLFHELIPGHHFQVALAHEDKTHHTLDKYLWNSGFGEGWALYVERLADEMGIYKDDISRLGMLSNEALRTARLVVDPGIHVMNWDRQQAIDYIKQHTALNESIIEAEVDRYIMMPGQATSYMLGKREIETLREQAKKSLGAKFDIRQYHNQVLKNGAVTLPMLRQQINSWLENT